MEELKDIIARMVSAGEPEENIKAVVEAYKAKNAPKQQPQTPGATVGKTTAPDMESKSEDTSSDSFGRVGEIIRAIGDAGKTWKSSKSAGDVIDAEEELVSKFFDNEVDDATIDKFIKMGEIADKTELTESEKEWDNAYDYFENKYDYPDWVEKVMPKQVLALLGATALEGEGGLTMMARSLFTGFRSEAALKTGLKTGLGSGLAVGGATAMTGPGALLAGGAAFVEGGLAGINLAVDSAMSFRDGLIREIPGYQNLSFSEKREAFKSIIEDKDRFESLLDKARARGLTTTAVSLLGNGVGKVAMKSTGKALMPVVSKRVQKAAEGVVGKSIEAPLEYGGELAAQAIGGEEISFKEAAKEAVGGFGLVSSPGRATMAKVFGAPTSYKIMGKEVSRQEMNRFIQNNDGVDLAGAGVTIEGDSQVKNAYLQKARRATLKTYLPDNITDEADRTAMADLEIEKQGLDGNKTRVAKERVKEINAEIDAISEKYKPKRGRPTKETVEAKTRLKAEAERLTKARKQAGVASTVAFAERVAKKYGFSVESVDNTKDFKSRIAKVSAEKNIDLPLDALKKINQVGGAVVGGSIIINKEVAAATGQFNVGSHEVLHPIVNAKLYSEENAVQIIDELKSLFSKEQVEAIEDQLTIRGYEDPQTRAKEYLTVMSDMMNTKNAEGKFLLDFDENKNVFEKIGQWLVDKIFRPLGYGDQAGFGSGKEVYQFMREYKKSIEQGDLTKATEKAIGDIKVTDGKEFEISSAARTDIDALGKDQTKAEWDAGGSNMAIAELYGDGVLDALMGSKITQEMRALPGFSEEDFISAGVAELIQHIRNFNPEKNDSLNGWIMSQVANKAKTVLKKQAAATKAQFTKEIDERSTSASGERFDIYEDDGFNFDENFDEELGEVIDPRDFFGPYKKEYQDAIHDILKNKNTIDDATFKKLDDLLPEYTEKITGIPAKKLGNPKTNLSTAEAAVMQKFVIENVDKLIKLLPEGAVMEAASEKVMRTGMGIPRKLLNAFYTKQARGTEGAGLSPFQKNKNITKAQFFDPFAIKPDGTPIAINGKDSRAQALFALGRLVGKITTNTAARIALESEQVNRQVIIDIGAGRSEFQLSQVPEDPARYAKAFENRLKNGEGNKSLKSYHGFTDADIDEVNKFSNNIYTKEDGKTVFRWEDIAAHAEFQRKIASALPPIIAKNKTYIKQFLGMHTGNNGYGITWEGKTSLVLYKDGNRYYSHKDIPGMTAKDNEVFPNTPGINSFLDADSNIEFSEKTKNLINQYSKEEKEFRKNNSASATPFINNDRTSEFKKNFSKYAENKQKQKFIEESLKITTASNAKLQNLGNEIVFNVIQDLFEGLSTVEEKKTFLKNIKIMYSAPSVANYGVKAGVPITGFIYSEKGGNYYWEHMDPAVVIMDDAFENLITGNRNYKPVESWVIPVWVQKILDQKYKTDNKNTRIEFLKKLVESGNIVTSEGTWEWSLSPKIDTMIDNSINDMASRKLGIDNKAEISEVKAKLMGQKKGKYKFWVPPSADDFMGLMQYLFRKGAAGDSDAAWIKNNIMKPFSEGIAAYEVYKQGMLTTFRRLKKELKNTPANLKKTLPNGFTTEQAVRVFLWAKKGMDIPGISQEEQRELVKLVGDDKNLRKFASEVSNMMAFDFPTPQENWIAGSLTTDLLEHVNEIARSEFLKDFITVSEEAFGKLGKNGDITGQTANKLRAAFGDNYVEALSDILYRMKNGRAREFGKNRLVGQFTNWVNNAVGNVMFFNTRSALLQQLSIINFMNWTDNNPLKMMQTWEDSEQYWKDYAMIFNSDFLKQRRGGLKTDVNADDIAREAETSTNKMKSALAGLLKMGFLPTQIADSNAIALGGASFYRNRVNTYLKEGLPQKQAEEQAFLDFKEVTEESQQSSRPDLVSQQQASGLGRIILAFANTPMQYARLTKKAAKDLVAGRGDWKTNASKIMYYGAVQNVIFTWLQQALFALLLDGEDEDDKDMEKYLFALNSTSDGILRGLGYGGAIASTAKNMVLEAVDQYKSGRPDYTKVALEATTISPPINSKLKAMMAAGRTFTWKQEREKISKEGFSLDNPAFYAAGQVSSALFNVPLHRAIRKMDNATYAMRHETETWQAIFLQLGYGQWELGLKDTKKDSSKKNRPKVKLPKRKKIKR